MKTTTQKKCLATNHTHKIIGHNDETSGSMNSMKMNQWKKK